MMETNLLIQITDNSITVGTDKFWYVLITLLLSSWVFITILEVSNKYLKWKISKLEKEKLTPAKEEIE